MLAGHLARPPRGSSSLPSVVLCHGFPSGPGGGGAAGGTYPALADRIANELGWMALFFTFRGAGQSEGQFSLGGWLDDVFAAIDHMRSLDSVNGVWLAGFGTGGSLCVCAAARDQDVRGVAALAAPADFDDWAGQPRRLLEHAREIELVSASTYPSSVDTWSRDLRTIRAVECVADLAPRHLLVVHGTEDDLVPDFDARVVADAHGSAELRIISGAGHQLRDDPRAVAVLLGWLDREATA
jgi:putative redox protein